MEEVFILKLFLMGVLGLSSFAIGLWLGSNK